jgi:hypothetical protein
MSTNKKTERTQTLTSTETKTSDLTLMEEKVVRMRKGYAAPSDMPLEYLEDLFPQNPKLAAELEKIERRVMEQVGARKTEAKRKIVASLKRKN